MTKSLQDVYIVAAKRTPVGKAGRALASARPDDLLAFSIQSVLANQSWLDPAIIDDLIVGCAMPEGEQGMNVARIGSLLAGLPDAVPAMTINRFCASGIQSVAQGAERIATGNADVILAGGVESMTRVPMGGFHYSANPNYFTNDKHLGIAYGMGITAEIVAEKYQVSRERQDEFAYLSHRRAHHARTEGYFNTEIAPIEVNHRLFDATTSSQSQHTITVSQDEGPRADTNIEVLSKLRTVFKNGGSITAGNSSQMSDGAGMVLLASERMVQKHNLTPLGRFVGFQVAGVAPEVMGIGPVAAVPKVLTQAGLKLNDIDWIELNEAFAAQALAVMDALELDPEKVNPQGGAIALGHPLGATGAIRICTALHGLQRTNGKYALITMCIGTGMGAAGIIETLG